jgi:hypothetical protein
MSNFTFNLILMTIRKDPKRKVRNQFFYEFIGKSGPPLSDRSQIEMYWWLVEIALLRLKVPNPNFE